MNTKHFYKDIDKYRDVPITTLLGIKNTGRRITILCPFHSEKTGSFNIYPDGSYHCYGCGEHGRNAIDFCRSLGYTFHDTIQELEQYI